MTSRIQQGHPAGPAMTPLASSLVSAEVSTPCPPPTQPTCPRARRVPRIRRFARMLIRGVTASLGALWLATTVSWARSYWYLDRVGAESAIRPGEIHTGGSWSSAAGSFEVEWWQRRDPREAPAPATGIEHTSQPVPSYLADARGKYAASLDGFHAMGFTVSHQDVNLDPILNPGEAPRSPARQVVWTVIVPYWQAMAGLTLFLYGAVCTSGPAVAEAAASASAGTSSLCELRVRPTGQHRALS